MNAVGGIAKFNNLGLSGGGAVLQLDKVRNYLSSHFILVENIDLSQYNANSSWQPIGTVENAFTGSFDGQRHTISGLKINLPDTRGVGLFSSISGNARISNIGLVDAKVTGFSNTGTLVGIMQGGTVTDAYAQGKVTGKCSFTYSGGLVGSVGQGATVSRSFANTQVDGTMSVGGLVGANSEYPTLQWQTAP
ncbi:hypothetical protein ACI7RC_09440 [Brevibacillus sp. B_LB10_24]|uniref:hypothetical protein n=1 Tax=Brevibacillus sp. B_LB10_24 TaxID=3380645 RepID=UPI0038BDF11F